MVQCLAYVAAHVAVCVCVCCQVNAENAAHCAEMEAMKKAFNGLRVEVSGYHRRLLGSITNQQASDIGMTA